MLKRILIAGLFLAAHAFGCASGFISIVDSFLLPNGTAWSGSIVYTLGYNTTAAGATIVNSRQQFNVTSGINICLAPGLYTPVVMNQGGISFPVTQSWGVPSSGGPYTIAQIQGNITLQSNGLQSNTVTVSNAQMLALNAAAVTLVPAPSANIVLVPARIVIEQQNATYVSDDQLLFIAAGTFSMHTVVGDFGPLSGMGGTYLDSYFFPGTINGQAASYAGLPLIAYADDVVTQPGGTGGNVTITTWYVTFTVQ